MIQRQFRVDLPQLLSLVNAQTVIQAIRKDSCACLVVGDFKSAVLNCSLGQTHGMPRLNNTTEGINNISWSWELQEFVRRFGRRLCNNTIPRRRVLSVVICDRVSLLLWLV